MRPTEILSSEHRVIEQVLDCLEKLALKAWSSRKLDGQAAKTAVDFFRTFADRCHHGKEENHLFRAMEAKGFSARQGPVAVMLHEHEQGRGHLRAMDGAIDRASSGDLSALREFVEHAEGYVMLLRQHIHKEDHVLFAMADQAFTDADQQALLAEFGKVEAKDMGEGTHEKYLAIAEGLCHRLGIAPSDHKRSGTGACCGCGH